SSSKNSSMSSNNDNNKEPNFEYEEEWDIDGIPELLNELDADIEKSFRVDTQPTPTRLQNEKYFVKDHFLKSSQNYNNSEKKIESQGNVASKHRKSSVFTGFSKGGHLISSASSASLTKKLAFESDFPADYDYQLLKSTISDRMSSQTVNNSNIGTNVGSCLSNVNSGQSGSSNINKSNTKMSIDHQATLDKGLKMKIKRTKPGTKSSEAKHEIVKATEQQQNGMSVVGSNVNGEESTNSVSSANSIQSSQTIANNQNVTSTGNKKNITTTSNQLSNNFSPGNNSCPVSSGILSSSIQNQNNSLGTKRTSSGHRREKVKDKSSHSNRNLNDKNNSQISEKETQDKNVCNCNNTDNSTSICSSNVCIRRNEGSVQRISNTTATVPPGVFTPSTETPNASVSATALLSVSTTATGSTVVTHSSTISGTANTPGPPNVGANIKISSHIAAQLAAAAASNSMNGSISHSDMKASTNNTEHQHKTPPGIISATVHHSIKVPLSNNKANDFSKSPPPKRAKPNEVKTQSGNAINKETVDICIGTSVGTITEPDCLGPCEPGTSVTLEGIVWHETEGGVLVVNVTWRGKTYVGTLLDCTRHDWAPPR
ncbi:putative uncharacterized protein DDB_G0286901, partial [Musca vetustissima]|uniref:putative uncharacterized protein DDB_G0286901 n=1 Tax=Musca vetustissima TaxID=27455 RepID=UPI002AB605BC